MNKLYYNRKFLFTIVTFGISFVSVIIYANISVIIENWFDSLKMALGVIGLIATLYNHWKKFNLLVTRIGIILFNSNTTWNVTATFDGEFDSKIQEKICAIVREHDSKMYREVVNDRCFRILTNGLLMQFDYTDIYTEDGDETQGHLVVQIKDFHASYEGAISALENKIIPVLSLIDKNVRSNSSFFKFKISFGKKNPFIGLAVKNVSEAKIDDFWYSYEKNNGFIKRTVKIRKQSIECSTNSLSDFQTSSINFLSLVGE